MIDSGGQPDKSKRLLYYFPIIHAASDMGGLEQTVRRLSIQHSGRDGWQHKKKFILQMWREIERALDALKLNYSKIRIYQDGLPVCGKEIDIVRDLAALGSPNHLLVLKLVDRGARLLGTESAELLVREYDVMKQGLEHNFRPASIHQGERSDKILDILLTRRDEFISQRINDTLEADDTGVVFLGMLHNLSPWLAVDIETVYPLYSPQHREAQDHAR